MATRPASFRLLAPLWLVGAIACYRAPPGAKFGDAISDAVEHAAERSELRLTVDAASAYDDWWQPEAALPRFHLFPRAEIAA